MSLPVWRPYEFSQELDSSAHMSHLLESYRIEENQTSKAHLCKPLQFNIDVCYCWKENVSQFVLSLHPFVSVTGVHTAYMDLVVQKKSLVKPLRRFIHVDIIASTRGGWYLYFDSSVTLTSWWNCSTKYAAEG